MNPPSTQCQPMAESEAVGWAASGKPKACWKKGVLRWWRKVCKVKQI